MRTKKLLKFLRAALPSLTALIAMLIIPFIFGLYFLVTRGSQQFITQENISFWDVQNNYWGRVFLGQTWLDLFDKAANYTWWALGGAILYIVVWSIAASKATVHNHFVEEGFVNFTIPRRTWHGYFAVEVLLKIALVILFLTCLVNVFVKGIPLMAESVTGLLQVVNHHNVIQLGQSVLLLVVLQAGCVTAIKVFRMVQFE